MNKKVMSATIVEAAKKEYLKKGYPGTEAEDIINTAKISKREFEDCFRSKEDVCLKVLKSYSKELKQQFRDLDENDNTRQRLSLFLDAYYDDAEKIAAEGCPIVNLYYDLRNMDNDLSETIEEILEMQHEWIDEQFVIMLKSESAIAHGNRLMAAVSGLLLLARLTGDTTMFKNQIIQLRSWIRSM